MTFGDKLKEIRRALDMSQDELADILGTSKQVISRYERGDRTPKLTTAQDYARKLNVPVEDLIDDSRRLLGVVYGHQSERLAEEPAATSDGLSEPKRELFGIMKAADDQQLQEILDFANYVLSKK